MGTRFKVIKQSVAMTDPILGRIDGMMELSEQCASCARHFSNRPGQNTDPIIACTAFDNGVIPEDILIGDFNHKKKHPLDNGLRYRRAEHLEEPKEKE